MMNQAWVLSSPANTNKRKVVLPTARVISSMPLWIPAGFVPQRDQQATRWPSTPRDAATEK